MSGGGVAVAEDLASGLRPAAVERACASVGISEEVARALVNTADAVCRSRELHALAMARAELVYESGIPPKEAVARWGEIGGGIGSPLPPLFDAIVLLAGYRRLEADHRRRGIPAESTAATLRDLELWIDCQSRARGAWAFREAGWLARHFAGRVHQVGRLQYEMHPFELPFVVLRRREAGDRDVAVAAEGGRWFREDGQFADADHGGAAAGAEAGGPRAWRSRFVEADEQWRVSLVGDDGAARQDIVALDRRQWEIVALRGDPVLAVHIPATSRFNGPLAPAACEESLRRAREFFARHFPEYPVRLLSCCSWMLDPQLGPFLPRSGNLASFQRFFRLVPVPGADDDQTMDRVFGGPVERWATAPRDTSLRRIIADGAMRGIRWRMGGGVIA